eukprot:360367-Chlamydomonas_euryale.AAC.1
MRSAWRGEGCRTCRCGTCPSTLTRAPGTDPRRRLRKPSCCSITFRSISCSALQPDLGVTIREVMFPVLAVAYSARSDTDTS